MRTMTYEDRVSKIVAPGDVDVQLNRAKSYIKSLRRRKRAADELDEKIEYDRAVKAAEKVLHRLRVNRFDLEDIARASPKVCQGEQLL